MRRFPLPVCMALIGALLLAAPASRAENSTDQCAPAEFARVTKTIGTFRKLELLANVLLQGQSEAIMEVGFDVPLDSDDDGGFFGPVGFLGKRTDKVQAEINALMKTVRYLKPDPETAARFEEVKAHSDIMIEAGFAMVPLLEGKNAEAATRLYAEQTLPAFKLAMRAAYTAVSGNERGAASAGLRCK